MAEVYSFFSLLSIFVLACFVGYYVVWSVTPALHTPLMSVTNAISSVIIVGALIAAGASATFDASKIFGLIAINKAPGLVVHPTYRHADGTIMNALLWRARGWPGSDRPSMVNRLDKLTSGIVVGAKTARAHAAMQRALAGDRAVKEYLALVYGRVPRRRGSIDFPLTRDPRDRRLS